MAGIDRVPVIQATALPQRTMPTGTELLEVIKSPATVHVGSLQAYPNLYNSVDCGLPGFSVLGILQARILEWVATSTPGPHWDTPKSSTVV